MFRTEQSRAVLPHRTAATRATEARCRRVATAVDAAAKCAPRAASSRAVHAVPRNARVRSKATAARTEPASACENRAARKPPADQSRSSAKPPRRVGAARGRLDPDRSPRLRGAAPAARRCRPPVRHGPQRCRSRPRRAAEAPSGGVGPTEAANPNPRWERQNRPRPRRGRGAARHELHTLPCKPCARASAACGSSVLAHRHSAANSCSACALAKARLPAAPRRTVERRYAAYSFTKAWLRDIAARAGVSNVACAPTPCGGSMRGGARGGRTC